MTALLLVATVVLPLVMAVACLWPGPRRRMIVWLGLAPLPASNNIGDLAKELAFAQQNSGISGLELVNGTEPFNPVL